MTIEKQIEKRIKKLESRQNVDFPKMVRIIVNKGETEEQAISRWMNETGKPKPINIIFRVIVLN